MWFQILSELFVNLAAGWFVAVFIETQFSSVEDLGDVLWLIFRVGLGILSLFVARFLREKTRST